MIRLVVDHVVGRNVSRLAVSTSQPCCVIYSGRAVRDTTGSRSRGWTQRITYHVSLCPRLNRAALFIAAGQCVIRLVVDHVVGRNISRLAVSTSQPCCVIYSGRAVRDTTGSRSRGWTQRITYHVSLCPRLNRAALFIAAGQCVIRLVVDHVVGRNVSRLAVSTSQPCCIIYNSRAVRDTTGSRSRGWTQRITSRCVHVSTVLRYL